MKWLNALVGELMALALLCGWLAGVVLAAGWWKLLATLFPPYAWYLVAEVLMQRAGLV